MCAGVNTVVHKLASYVDIHVFSVGTSLTDAAQQSSYTKLVL